MKTLYERMIDNVTNNWLTKYDQSLYAKIQYAEEQIDEMAQSMFLFNLSKEIQKMFEEYQISTLPDKNIDY